MDIAMAPASTARSKSAFDPGAFLVTIGEATKPVLFPKKQTIFAQGDPADAVFYLQTGKIKLSVVAKTDREATIGLLSDGSFFGEGALAGQSFACIQRPQ